MRNTFNKKSMVATMAFTAVLGGCSSQFETPTTEATIDITPIKDTLYQPLDVQCSGASAAFTGRANGSVIFFNDVITYIDKDSGLPKLIKKQDTNSCTISNSGYALNVVCEHSIPSAGWPSGQTGDVTISGTSLKFANKETQDIHEINQYAKMICVVYGTPHEKSLRQRFGELIEKISGETPKSVTPQSVPSSPKI